LNFIDEATITVFSGKGGAGCVSFRREKFIPKGGPDGGDGGKGGDVILEVSPRLTTLFHFKRLKLLRAQDGRPGAGRSKSGRNGENLTVQAPPGTMVYDAETDTLLEDLTHMGQQMIVAQGGRGGQGNARFKSATNRTPRFAQPGEPGQTRQIRLELKLLADVGIIGLPNAGKSTLITKISSARPKIAGYPFTTLTPNLGVVAIDDATTFVVADIPGLIEGAHTGAGLGTQFLRHIERTRLLVHLVDAAAIDPENPLDALNVINNELARYSPVLAEKIQLVVLNKMDLPEAEANAAAFEKALQPKSLLPISAATGQGAGQLVRCIAQTLYNQDEKG